MNTSKIKKNAISLSEFAKNLSNDERKIVEAEKKYYQVVINLRQKRELMGMTQQKLAQLSNVPRTTITKVESGSRNATLQTLMAMAQAMGNSMELRLV